MPAARAFRAAPRVHRRRVPGREPAAADPARAVARRPRRPVRGRRRLPVDLRIHGRDSPVLLGVPERSRVRRSSGSRTTTAPRRRCSRWRTGSSRSSAGHKTLGRPPGRAGARFAPFATPDAETAISSGGSALHATGPFEEMAVLVRERAPGRLRGGVRTGGHPLPGRGAARARRPRGGCCARSTAGRQRAGVRGARARARARSTTARRSSASGSRRGRPTWRGSYGSRTSSGRRPAASSRPSSARDSTPAARPRGVHLLPTTARRGWSSTRCSSRGWRRGSCPRSARTRRRGRGGAAAAVRRDHPRGGPRLTGRASRAGSSLSSAPGAPRRPNVEPDEPLLRGAEDVAAGARAGATTFPRTSSSTTRRWRRSRAAARGAWRSSPPSPASAPRSSIAMAKRC